MIVLAWNRRRIRNLWIQRGVHWGPTAENGVWLAEVSRRRFMWRKHSALYIAAGRLRIRIMKPLRWRF